MKRRLDVFDVANALLLTALMVVTLVPFVHVAAVSISEPMAVLANKVSLWPAGFDLFAYRKVLTDARVLRSYRNTLLYTSVGTALNMAFTATMAYALASPRLVLRRVFTVGVVFTMLFNGGIVPTYLLVKGLGIIDTLWAVTLPVAINTWNLLVMRSFFQGIPESIQESAMMDGANDIGIFVAIILPLSQAVLATIALFYAVYHWNSFFQPLIYLNSSTRFPLQITLRSMVIEGNLSPPEGMTLAEEIQAMNVVAVKYTVVMVAAIPILCVYPFVQRYFVRGVMIGSIKG